MVLGSPVSVINRTIEEDRFDIPDVPMEEDRLFLVFLIPLMAWYELKTAHAI